MNILVINAGSSSLKFALYDAATLEVRATGLFDWNAKPVRARLVIPPAPAVDLALDSGDHASAVTVALRRLTEHGLFQGEPVRELLAVGHRVVHGGAVFRSSVRVDAKVKQALRDLSELAPLHNPPALAGIDAAEAALPGVPQVAVFDTAFFADLPPRAFVYPGPYEWYTEQGIRRFGFHGISHHYCAGRAPELLGREPDRLRIITCHLGNGCSASAVDSGKAVATTMGYTPMEGLMMGTRSGSIDPGILLHLLRQRGLSANELDDVLNHRSGLLGVSGVAADYRQVEAAANAGNERARLALDIFADRVRAAIGALAVTTGGVDALVFTAGIGENAAGMRAAVCEKLGCLGVELDDRKNANCRPDADVAKEKSGVRVLVLQTREELMIAREARRLATTT
jgi:acetate kinase